jgi:hypothetical protein
VIVQVLLAGTPAESLAVGYYLIELDGSPNGIRSPAGVALDGEFLNSFIAGASLPGQWNDTPSGNGVPGGNYVAAFTVFDPVDVRLQPVAENAAGAVAGAVSVDGVPANDLVWTVSDGRLEVVAGQIQLKADQSLNFF